MGANEKVAAAYHGSRADLRDAIARALCDGRGWDWDRLGRSDEWMREECLEGADAVLSVVAPYLDQRDAALALADEWEREGDRDRHAAPGERAVFRRCAHALRRALGDASPTPHPRVVIHAPHFGHGPFETSATCSGCRALGDASPTKPRPVEPHPAGSHAAWLARHASPPHRPQETSAMSEHDRSWLPPGIYSSNPDGSDLRPAEPVPYYEGWLGRLLRRLRQIGRPS